MARRRAPKVEPRQYTPEEEAQFEVKSREWAVETVEERINSRLSDVEYRLTRTVDEIKRIRESDWRTLEQKAEAVAHEIAWMTPNMGLEYLIGECLDLDRARKALEQSKAKLDALTPVPFAETVVEEA